LGKSKAEKEEREKEGKKERKKERDERESERERLREREGRRSRKRENFVQPRPHRLAKALNIFLASRTSRCPYRAFGRHLRVQ
jgi:hypothetical protein